MKMKAFVLSAGAHIASLIMAGAAQAQSGGDSGGAGAAQTTDQSHPLAPIRLQNYFIPSTPGAEGYANTTVLQAIIPMYLNNDFIPYHIMRPTLPFLNRSNYGQPQGEGQGVGDLTFADVYVIPLDGINSTLGGGYTVRTRKSDESRQVIWKNWKTFAIHGNLTNWLTLRVQPADD